MNNLGHSLSYLRTRRVLPALLQTEASECGIVSLAMIACYHGHKLDLAAMRRRFPTSLKGSSLSGLIEIAHRLGFNTRPLRVEPDYVAELQTPCLLHWDMNHMVVLKEATRGRFVIHDPNRGVIRLSQTEFSRHFTGVALEFDPAEDFKPIIDRQAISIRSIVGRIVGIKRALLQVLLFSVALEVFILISPFLIQGVVDEVLVTRDQELLTLLGCGFLVVTLFQSLITGIRGSAVAWISARINSQWETNLFRHLMRLPMDYFEKRHMGDVLSRFGSIQTIERTLSNSFVEAALDGCTVLLTVALLTIYSLRLTAVVGVAFVAYALLRLLSVRFLRNFQEEQIHQFALQQTALMESIRGVQAIKLANAQSERISRFSNMAVAIAGTQLRGQRLGSLLGALNQFIFGVERVVIIWLGAAMVLRREFSVGMMLAFVAYAEQFLGRSASLIDKIVEFKLLRLQAERIADISLAPAEPDVEVNFPGSLSGAVVQVDDVSFRYSDTEPWILRNCRFQVEAGESIAITGPSGCGKTTLAKLILGLLQPNEGAIRVGGVDVRRVGLRAYREMLGTVMQDDVLFSGSIAENICFFDPTPDMSRIVSAAQKAAIHEDLIAMPMGYETLVGDMGSALSGGQKQRVLLARALYRNPRILILDEATSHLDVANEQRVNAIVKTLDITRVYIAHRPETIASADKVVLLENGRVVHFTDVEKFRHPKAASALR